MSIRDWLADAVGQVVRDARQRVVERGWYGESVTPRSQTITLGTPDRSAGERSPAEGLGWTVPGEEAERSEGLGWFEKNFAPDASREAERAERTPEQERGIER